MTAFARIVPKGEDPIVVQFNPTTLQYTRTNQNDGGQTTGNNRAEHVGIGAANLTVELLFDTSEEGTTEDPRSVLDYTNRLESLLLPRGKGEKKQAPPPIQFEWGKFVFVGVVESLSLTIDLFSESGVPLRARAGLGIKEQREDVAIAAKGGSVLGALTGLTAGGLSGYRDALSTATPLADESPAELAARIGIDPANWRSLVSPDVQFPAGGDGDPSVTYSSLPNRSIGAARATGFASGVTEGMPRGTVKAIRPVNGVTDAAVIAASTSGNRLAGSGGLAAFLEDTQATGNARAINEAKRSFAATESAIRLPRANSTRPPIADRSFQKSATSTQVGFGYGVPFRSPAGSASHLFDSVFSRSNLPGTGAVLSRHVMGLNRRACNCGCGGKR